MHVYVPMTHKASVEAWPFLLFLSEIYGNRGKSGEQSLLVCVTRAGRVLGE